MDSYKLALPKYLEWQRQREVAKQIEDLRFILEAVELGELPVKALGDSPWAQRYLEDRRRKNMITRGGFLNKVVFDPATPGGRRTVSWW